MQMHPVASRKQPRVEISGGGTCSMSHAATFVLLVESQLSSADGPSLELT